MALRERAAAEADPDSLGRDPGPLGAFIERVSPHLSDPTHLAPLVERLESVPDETVELCVSVPPRHGKTTTILHWIAWLLVRDPTLTILYCSYAHGFAAKQARKARGIAQRAGVILGETQRQDEWTTASGGGLKAAGLGGQMTGEGFRVVVIDDPHKSRAEAESRTIRERVIDGFTDDVYTRQDPRGTSFVVVHTRWHEHDLIGTVSAPSEEGRPFELINLRAIRDDGGALAPALFSVDKLERIRAQVGEYGWASLYMGEPRPRGGALFADVVMTDETPRECVYAIGVDLAYTTKSKSDYHASVVMARGANGAITIVDVVLEQGALTDKVRDGARIDGVARAMYTQHRRYQSAIPRMYVGRNEFAVIDLLAYHRDYPLRIEATPAPADKYVRAQAYAAAWNAGSVRILSRVQHVDELISQHRGFTGARGERDDLVDACVAAYDALAAAAPSHIAQPLERRPTLTTRRRWT